jgi:hypothetical protein
MFSSFYTNAQILLTPLTNISLAQFATKLITLLHPILAIGHMIVGTSSNHSLMFISPFIHLHYSFSYR